jgi:hypothetical protein
MSRRFRLVLFLCLAVATGLHLRACLGTLWGAPSPSAGASSPALAVRTASEGRAPRPSLGEMGAAPTRIGLEAAVAEAR